MVMHLSIRSNYTLELYNVVDKDLIHRTPSQQVFRQHVVNYIIGKYIKVSNIYNSYHKRTFFKLIGFFICKIKSLTN